MEEKMKKMFEIRSEFARISMEGATETLIAPIA